MFFRFLLLSLLQCFLIFGDLQAKNVSSVISKEKVILVTGGTGYIGSHVAIVLLNAGYRVAIVDNLSNSKSISLDHIEKITSKKVSHFYQVDMRNYEKLRKVFSSSNVVGVIHLAGLKAVGESVEKPLLYYQNNLDSTINLLLAMKDANVHNLIFSSSATVYGDPQYLPIDEKHPIQPTNPYGRTKSIAEEIMQDTANSWKEANFISLRYFNPIGAHESGEIGEDPKGIPNNLVPYILRVVSGKLDILTIYGKDYATKDGTGVRDYIHVMDLAEGHLAALKHLERAQVGYRNYNLGTGVGYSVLDILKEFENLGKKIPHKFGPRRPGDIATSYANAELAQRELGWSAKRSLKDMVRDALNWAKKYPNGFE